MAQSRIKLLKKMENTFIPAVLEDPTFSFEIENPDDTVPPPYTQAIDISFGYVESLSEGLQKGKILFKNVNFNIDMDTRIALVGRNGAGKSTFLKVLSKALTPLAGAVNVNAKARIGYFSQHHNDQLTMHLTPLEYMKSKFPEVQVEAQFRSQLSKVGLAAEHHMQSIYSLSGGQKSRLCFAEMIFKKPHVLILDEPTNHLDMDTIDALINALNQYEGGIVIVSHDQHLINSVCDEIWVVGNGQCSRFNGGFDDYAKTLQFKID